MTIDPHRCHAIECRTITPRRMLMCPKHWRMVPPHLKRLVWTTYRSGQEERLDPTHEYLIAAHAAACAVAVREGVRLPEAIDESVLGLAESLGVPAPSLTS